MLIHAVFRITISFIVILRDGNLVRKNKKYLISKENIGFYPGIHCSTVVSKLLAQILITSVSLILTRFSIICSLVTDYDRMSLFLLTVLPKEINK